MNAFLPRIGVVALAAALVLTSLSSAAGAAGNAGGSGLKILNSDVVRVVYPYDLAMAGTDATVEISFRVDAKGAATEVTPTKISNADATAAFLASLDEMVFETAKVDGKPVLSERQELSINLRQTQLAGDLTFISVIKNPAAVVVAAREVDGGLKPAGPMAPALYPSSLRKSGLKQGRAVLEFYIDPAGIVRLPKVLSATDPAMGWSAAAAALTWRFAPPLKGGQPAIVKVTGFPVPFTAPSETVAAPTGQSSLKADVLVESVGSMLNPQLKVNGEVLGSLPRHILLDVAEDGTLSRDYDISINFTDAPSILAKIELSHTTNPPARITFSGSGTVEARGTALIKR